ncbi:MAG: two-component sensor histidine kinase, partial [Pseudomonadota bacterium]
MADDTINAFLAAIPLPALAIDGSERIVAANADALTLVGQQALDMNYVAMLRQPMLLDVVEATLG